MIELTKVIQTSDGVLVPAGVRLEFKNGVAKYQGHPIKRELVPLQVIKGASGPFLHACSATLLNDCKRFQDIYNRKYQDWAHMVVLGDNLLVYVWDTREVIDVISGIRQAAKGGPIQRVLVNKKTGERITQTLGWHKWGWTKSMYEMMLWPAYHRIDNGLPLKTNEAGWKEAVDEFNAPVLKKHAFESVDAYIAALQAREAGQTLGLEALRAMALEADAAMTEDMLVQFTPHESMPDTLVVKLDGIVVGYLLGNIKELSGNKYVAAVKVLTPEQDNEDGEDETDEDYELAIRFIDKRSGVSQAVSLSFLEGKDVVEVEELRQELTKWLSENAVR